MRILYLHQYFVPPGAPGGTRSYEFARRLIAQGHRVQIITSSAMFPSQYYSDRRLITETSIEDIPTVIINVRYSNEMDFPARVRAFLLFAVVASIEALRRPADVVFATSTPLTIAIPGIIARFWHHIPMVFEVRDLWPELPIAMGALRNPVMKMLARWLEWLAYHNSAHIVALSPGMAEGVVRRGIASNRVTVIPNSCDVDRFDVSTNRGRGIRARLPGLTEGQPLVVYTGTFGKINGVSYLVDIAEAMCAIDPQIRFLLVGSGAEKPQIIARAQERGVLDRNLWIWDSISKIEMPDVLAAATVATSVFIPLEPMWHNSANKFFDALAAGRPVAINHGGWQAELLRESGAGVVLPPNDPYGAARIIASFVNQPGWLRHAATAARTLAYKRFHRDAMAAQLENILRQVGEDSDLTERRLLQEKGLVLDESPAAGKLVS